MGTPRPVGGRRRRRRDDRGDRENDDDRNSGTSGVWVKVEATANDDGHGGEPAGVDRRREPISVDTTGEPAFVSRMVT